MFTYFYSNVYANFGINYQLQKFFGRQIMVEDSKSLGSILQKETS